ncbi:MAG: peptide deformylase [Planctomycetes bacterium]|nr:peptide deformylase [Planctomycetota bacterium]MBI3843120.1 peptide deformylase [Planctomycetota bacterium]
MQLLYYPDPRLREVALPVPVVDEDVRANAKEMIEIMHAHKGIGLAATQVGWNRRLFVVGSPEGEEGRGLERVFVNPKIVSAAGAMESEEGCLSLPGIYATLRRSSMVVMEALDLEGRTVRLEAEKLLASVIQHEIDHLDGVLFITRLSPADRQRVKKQLRELEEKYRPDGVR